MEAAAAAHSVADPRLTIAANFLMLNAAASMAMSAFGSHAGRGGTCFLISASILLGGSLLFCADLSLRVFAAVHLFAFAAPIGGMLMIIGWLSATATALVCSLSGLRRT
jgi:uncharacterized membrane protein YgdD (TMEM256/DUF423 family)